MAPVLKTGIPERVSGVRIPHSPPELKSISDYRPVGKVLFAFGAAQTAGSITWTRKLTEVKFNEPIDHSVFLKPEKKPHPGVPHQYLKLNLSNQIEYEFCLEFPSC